jgi:hypothetical protein
LDCELVSEPQSDELNGSGGNTPIITYEAKFNELFPMYLCMGMTEEQYWDKDCTLVIYYRKADELKQERKNYELWLQGMYIYDAIARISPILQPFAKKGTKARPYVSEPYAITKVQADIKEEEKAKKTYNKGKRFMERFLVDTNKKFSKPND